MSTRCWPTRVRTTPGGWCFLYPWDEGLCKEPILRRWKVAGTETVFDVAAVDIGKPRQSVARVLRRIVDANA